MVSQQWRLASLVKRRLAKRKKVGRLRKAPQPIPLGTLRRLFDLLFFTSIKTEEARSLQLRVFYISPDDPDPDAPPMIRSDRWRIFRLATAIPLTVAGLAKIAKSADPWSSGAVIFHDSSGELYIWGLVDQVSAISLAFVQETSGGYDPPGIFHVLVGGPADITVFRGSSFIARLAQESIVDTQNDCLWEGAIGATIDNWIYPRWKRISKEVGKKAVSGWTEYWKFEVKSLFTATLSRILINIQRQRHGGAILFSPESNLSDLSIKYELEYPRIVELSHEITVRAIGLRNARDKMEWDRLNEREDVSFEHYRNEVLNNAYGEDAERALSGAVRFVSAMAGVDGLILASPDFAIRGFGVEITTRTDVSQIMIASSPDHAAGRLSNAHHFGTRHRSMFRYCAQNPSAIGFVVSQDGDIRAVKSIGGMVVMFENVKVHSLWDDDLHKMTQSYLPKPKKNRKIRPAASKSP